MMRRPAPLPVLSDFRPRFHFTARSGWLNDPNGLIQVDGTYHLFYQYHPDPCPVDWWRKEWGHATSTDLVSWVDQPLALSPGAGRPDADGCWSGCAVDAGEEIRIYYTGVIDQMRQLLCLARGDRKLNRLAPEHAPLEVEGVDFGRGRTFRDPYVWREGGQWRALIAGTLPDLTAEQGVMELASEDGIRWRPAVQRITVAAGSNVVMECPNRFVIRGREIILCSAQPLWAPVYSVGEPGEIHSVDAMKLLMSASRFYAPLVFADEKGRLIMMGYSEEARSFASIAAAGWGNALSLPIELDLDDDDQLVCRPVAELARLRRSPPGTVEDVALAESPRFLSGISGHQCEIECELECGEAEKIWLDVLADPAGREFTRIEIDPCTGGLEIDNAHSSLDPATLNQGDNERQGPRKKEARDTARFARKITLRVFVDRSMVDVFSDAGVFATQRAYPSLAESTGVRISAQGAGARVIRCFGWEMEEILQRADQ